jgi:hypothetical protein
VCVGAWEKAVSHITGGRDGYHKKSRAKNNGFPWVRKKSFVLAIYLSG